MIPSNIVGMATVKQLDAIAVTDHNSCKNCPAVMKLAKSYGIVAVPGMELTTAEEVHVLCLFRTLEGAMSFDSYVSKKLIPFLNDVEIFGSQHIYDENDIITGTEPYLLINATEIGFDSVYELTESYGGIMIPAHIDKSANSLLANLGFIPPDSRFACAEVKRIGLVGKLTEKNPYLDKCRIITNSDAHYLCDIHEPDNFLEVQSKSVDDIIDALGGKNTI
jgi:PHP family Zn ribbon phosphoesterase